MDKAYLTEHNARVAQQIFEADGWAKPGPAGRHPLWDGGECLMSDGSLSTPVGHQWAPFNEIYVIAYKPEPSHD